MERAELQREVTGVDGERRSTALCTGAGRGGAPPGAWTSRIDAGCSCGGGGGVSVAGAAPAVSNCSDSELPAAAESGENPAQAKVEVGVGGRSAAPGALAKLLQGWPGWRHGGAASSRRRRGSARRGKARWAELGFCGRRVRWMGAGGSVAVFIGRRSALGVRARAGNHGEIPGRELRCAGETDLSGGPGGAARRGRGTRAGDAGCG